VDKGISTSLHNIREKLTSVFPKLDDLIFSVCWRDEEDDCVSIDTDEELVLALTQMTGPVYKLNIIVKEERKRKTSRDESTDSNMVHPGVICDGCDKAMVGFRYKCMICPDFDLCGLCERMGKHPNHNMVRISKPQVISPHRLFRKLHKMQQKAEKRERSRQKEESGVRAGDDATQEAHTKDEEPAGCTNQSAAAAAATKVAEEVFAAAGVPKCKSEEYLDFMNKVGEFVTAVLDPLGIDVKVDVETRHGEETKKGEEKVTEQMEEQTKEGKEKKEENKKQEEELVTKKGSMDNSDDEEWTVVNDKKDETQSMEETSEASVYPHLAVTESSSVAGVSDSKEVTKAVHTDPRIQVALQAMINMGFNNEGGWLTNLLEVKDGDIGKVLDILQPARK